MPAAEQGTELQIACARLRIDEVKGDTTYQLHPLAGIRPVTNRPDQCGNDIRMPMRREFCLLPYGIPGVDSPGMTARQTSGS